MKPLLVYAFSCFMTKTSPKYTIDRSMSTLLSPIFSSVEWSSLGDTTVSHDYQQSYVYKDAETSESYLDHVHPSQQQDHHDQYHRFAKSTWISGDPTMVKKLNHNASERDRRKKMNTLYSSLRSILPAVDQSKKLGVPATVTRVLKYIPQLQDQVEGMLQKKEVLLSNFSRQGDMNCQEETQCKNAAGKSSSAVSASRLNDREVTLQITTCKFHNCSLTEILLYLEENGLLLLNASSFESFGGRVFYNLHFQVEGTNRLDCEFLSEKVVSLIEKREEYYFLKNIGHQNLGSTYHNY